MTPETYESILDRIRATPDTPAENIAECGYCHFKWDDTIPTELTPAPSGRCPNEYNHVFPDETEREILLDDLKTLVSAIPEEIQDDATYFASQRLLRFIENHSDK